MFLHNSDFVGSFIRRISRSEFQLRLKCMLFLNLLFFIYILLIINSLYNVFVYFRLALIRMQEMKKITNNIDDDNNNNNKTTVQKFSIKLLKKKTLNVALFTWMYNIGTEYEK